MLKATNGVVVADLHWMAEQGYLQNIRCTKDPEGWLKLEAMPSIPLKVIEIKFEFETLEALDKRY